MLRLAAALFAILVSLTAAQAQAPKTILVLDASGSMWGQIETKHKIEIAREVLDQVLEDIPAERELGLVAYGHNRKGDCSDIEQLAPVGADRESISKAVHGLNPRGKTPLSDAVVFAAEQLKYTEEPATVILISDGIETCEADPCEVGKKLEQSGVDFTAHVVGFDVTEEDALKQLQCLAENTGGQFISASNASELTDALQETVVQVAAPEPEPEPEPAPVAEIMLLATENTGGPEITEGLNWVVQQSGGGEVVFTANNTGRTSGEIPSGTYDIFVTREGTDQSAKMELVTVAAPIKKNIVLPIEVAYAASIRTVPEATFPVGSDFVAYWEGPGKQSDMVVIVGADEPQNRWINYSMVRDGNPLKVTAPVEPGDYEVRYLLGSPTTQLASTAVTLTDVTASVSGPAQVGAGSTFSVDWDGPAYKADWVTIVLPDAKDNAYGKYFYPQNQKNELTAPLDPGMYELRYVLHGKRVIGRAAIEVLDVTATVDGPAEVKAGARFDVSWTGAAEQGDWVTIVLADADDRQYLSYFYPKKNAAGNPVDGELKAPLDPGTYELRYVQGGQNVIATAAITVLPVTATLQSPGEVPAGAKFDVAWTGEAEQGDWVTIVRPDEDETRYRSYFYPKKNAAGNPVDGELTAPIDPGQYELRYVQGGKIVLATAPITVAEVTATLDFASQVEAGSEIEVDWDGPATQGDYVTFLLAGEKEPRRGTNYFYPVKGREGSLNAPLEPGDYEMIYLQDGKKELARVPFTVVAVSATVSGPESAVAGTDIEVAWTGPGDRGDLVSIAGVDDKPGKLLDYFYATPDKPTELTLPLDAGTYELRYIQAGEKILATQTITVTEANASLTAAASGVAGSEFAIEWDGPGAQRDLITVAAPNAKDSKYYDYFYARKGGTATVELPLDPGTYELRYVLGGKKTVFATGIEVTAAAASLDAPAEVIAEQPLTITWTGPDQRADLVTIATADQKPNKYTAYQYARRGSPVEIVAPAQPGDYEIRYVQHGKKVIATAPLKVVAGQ